MQKPYQLVLHIFRRDLRLHDNQALLFALAQAQEVIPCFIFDKRQIEINAYKSENCLQFMLKSLQELADDLSKRNGRLFFFYGIAEDVITKLLEKLPIQAVCVNRDYTPFSKNRDEKIAQACKRKNVDFLSYADALLTEPEQVLKTNQHPYTIFTPFYKKAINFDIPTPQKNQYRNYYKQEIGDAIAIPKKLVEYCNSQLFVKGGRKEALNLLKKIVKLSDYSTLRNYPALDLTTHLSAHHKFGTVSIRESYHAIKDLFGLHHDLIKELFWRDFFTHIVFHFPYVLKGAFHKKYDKLLWKNNSNDFQAWCEGRTGFPIVDAGMRQLNATGFMPNRIRMIAGSFLIKDLNINWRWGEKYFAEQLVDYDPSVNNGNWQWVSSTGCDAQPFFRIFNPWLQQKKFDPECLYIKQWIPELRNLKTEEIHSLFKNKISAAHNYPAPIIEHDKESKRIKQLYRRV